MSDIYNNGKRSPIISPLKNSIVLKWEDILKGVVHGNVTKEGVTVKYEYDEDNNLIKAGRLIFKY